MTSNITSALLDLATKDTIEKYMYCGQDASTYFIRQTHKSSWFTQLPVHLNRVNGNTNFGSDWTATVSRTGDYLLHTWLRVVIPEVKLMKSNRFGVNGRIRWTKNLMHNLIVKAGITFNELSAHSFDNYYLDFWSAFTCPASKKIGYNNMIGNIPSLTNPSAEYLPKTTLNLPLPFFFSRDCGVALPTASLVFNEIHIHFSFRDWTSLLILEDISITDNRPRHDTITIGRDLMAEPKLTQVQLWGNYAMVAPDERAKMGCATREMVIETYQKTSPQTFDPNTNGSPSVDVRFTHAVKVLFFAVRNTTTPGEWSNYSTHSPFPMGSGNVLQTHKDASDPLNSITIQYENVIRLGHLGADYYSLVNPWYHAPSIPEENGYHCYSYALSFVDVDPTGSTNYGKMTNVSCIPEASEMCKIAATGSDTLRKQTFEFIIMAVTNTVVRISGGVLGFVVL